VRIFTNLVLADFGGNPS